MENICVIPARGGSKRIPKKNIRNFFGEPIIKYSINVAKESRLFKQIIVSTDDAEIAKIAQDNGAEIPFFRPSNLSDDYCGIKEVINHTINHLFSKKIEFKYVCCLFATAPFVTTSDLREGYKSLSKVGKDRFTFSATKYCFPIERALFKSKKDLTCVYDNAAINKRSQDLKEYFHDAGQFYWGSSEAWFSKLNLFKKSLPIMLPTWRVQDLDTFEDWQRAELMYSSLLNKKSL